MSCRRTSSSWTSRTPEIQAGCFPADRWDPEPRRGQAVESTATSSATQTSRIRSSLSRPSRSTSIAIDTLSTESRLIALRRLIGSSAGSRTTSLGRPRMVVVHGATSARRSRGIAESLESTTTGRRPISGSSHHQSSPRRGSRSRGGGGFAERLEIAPLVGSTSGCSSSAVYAASISPAGDDEPAAPRALHRAMPRRSIRCACCHARASSVSSTCTLLGLVPCRTKLPRTCHEPSRTTVPHHSSLILNSSAGGLSFRGSWTTTYPHNLLGFHARIRSGVRDPAGPSRRSADGLVQRLPHCAAARHEHSLSDMCASTAPKSWAYGLSPTGLHAPQRQAGELLGDLPRLVVGLPLRSHRPVDNPGAPSGTGDSTDQLRPPHPGRRRPAVRRVPQPAPNSSERPPDRR